MKKIKMYTLKCNDKYPIKFPNEEYPIAVSAVRRYRDSLSEMIDWLISKKTDFVLVEQDDGFAIYRKWEDEDETRGSAERPFTRKSSLKPTRGKILKEYKNDKMAN